AGDRLLRPGDRPGHDLDSLHPVRPPRPAGVGGAAGAPPALPAPRLGRARRDRDLAQRAPAGAAGAGPGRRRRRAGRRDRDRQPAGDDRAVGPAHRGAGGPGRGLAGHPDRRADRGAGGGRRARPLHRPVRAAAGHLLRRAADPLAAGRHPGAAGPGGARRGALRHHGDLADLEPDRRPGRRHARHRRDQRVPDDADGHRHPRVVRRAARRDRRAARGAAGDPVVRGGVRQGLRGAARGADRRRPRRPAGGAVRADLLRPGRGQVHVRHRLVPAAQHRPGDRPVLARAAHHGRLQDRRRRPGVRAGGRDRDHRLAGAVVPGQPRADQQRRGDRDAGAERRRQRRGLHRARVLRAVRAALAVRGPRHHRRAHLVRHQGALGAGGAGGDRLADPRGGGRDERRLRDRADHAAGGRRDDRGQPAHAVRRGRAGRAGGPADGAGDGVARRRVRGRARGRLLAGPGGAAAQLAPGRAVAAQDGPRPAGGRVRELAAGGRADLRLAPHRAL
ncbi:MAG: Glycerol kinase, partial [uncultured Corynebacteriales bacterium]